MCDYEKGDDATTAMGLEEHPEMCTFWITANVDASTKVVPFVKDILGDLGKLLGLVLNEKGITPDAFEKKCVEFARCRIKEELRLLRVLIDLVNFHTQLIS